MSPELLEPDLREWDLGAVPTEVLVSALGRPAEESARECARASCVIAIAESVAPPEYPDRTMIHEYMRERRTLPWASETIRDRSLVVALG